MASFDTVKLYRNLLGIVSSDIEAPPTQICKSERLVATTAGLPEARDVM